MRLWPRRHQGGDAEKMARFNAQFAKATLRSEYRRVTFLAGALSVAFLFTLYAVVWPGSEPRRPLHFTG